MLVPPNREDILRATRRLVGEDPQFPHPEALIDLGHFLPTNPRRLKLVIRLVRSLAGQLQRFSPDEIDLRRAFLIQMLRVEFPLESLALVQDEEAVESIESTFVTSIFRDSGANDDDEIPPIEERYAPPAPPERRSRFLELCAAIRERETFKSESGLLTLFHLVDRPVVMTWKEFDELLSLRSEPEILIKGLSEILQAQDSDEVARRIDAVWDKIVEGGERIFSSALEAEGHDKILEWLELLPSIYRLIRVLGVEFRHFETGELGADHWLKLWKLVMDWDRFTQVAEYLPLRLEERSLIQDLVAVLPSTTRATIWIRMLQKFEEEKLGADLNAIRTQLKSEFESAAADQAFAKFELQDGGGGVLGCKERHSREAGCV